MSMEKRQDMSAINDPFGQTHSPDNSDHYSRLKVDLFCELLKSGDGRTKIVIIIGRDCGLDEWINFLKNIIAIFLALNTLQR